MYPEHSGYLVTCSKAENMLGLVYFPEFDHYFYGGPEDIKLPSTRMGRGSVLTHLDVLCI